MWLTCTGHEKGLALHSERKGDIPFHKRLFHLFHNHMLKNKKILRFGNRDQDEF